MAALLPDAAVTFGQKPEAASEDPPDPGLIQGPLSQASEPIGKILALRTDGGQLVLDRRVWNSQTVQEQRDKKVAEYKARLVAKGMSEEDAQDRAEYAVQARGVRLLVRELGKEIQANRTGMRPGPGGGSISTVNNGHLVVEVDMGQPFRFRAREIGQNPVQLQVRDKHGRLSIFLARFESDWMFHVRQEKDAMVVTEVLGDRLTHLRARDFAEFYRKHGAFTRNRLLPVLGHHGISMLTPENAEVRAVILKILEDPVDPAEMKKVRGLIDQLGGGKFRERQAANEQLAGNYVRWLGPIQAAAADPTTPAEARARLRAIIDAHRGEHRHRELIWQLGLHEDVEYLIDLLDDVEDKQASLVAAQIRTLTGKDLGADAAVWDRWWKQQEGAQGE
jgi:hypothetical protein